jgi:hypothetical protein
MRRNRSGILVDFSKIQVLFLGLFLLNLCGCGIHANPIAQLFVSPSSLSWHSVNVGQTSSSKTVTVTNMSKSVAVSIASVTASDQFLVTGNTCPTGTATLAPSASCTISVAFRPTSTGNVSGSLLINDNAWDGPHNVALAAKGSTGSLIFSPTSLSFPGVPAGSTSQPQNATLTNKQSSPVTIQSITVSGHFVEGTNCPIAPSTLGVGESCTVTVSSKPVASGSITGSINVRDNFGNVTQLYLSGSDSGQPVVGSVSFSPVSLTWGTVTVGQTSGSKTITVTNNQTTSLAISYISIGPDFIQTGGTCPLAPATIPAGGSCTISVAFRPTSSGSKTELLSLIDNAPGSPHSALLSATGATGSLIFNPVSLSFAGVAPGQASSPQQAVLMNQSSANVSLATITVSGHFAQKNDCPGTLAPQTSCTFNVTSNPVATGTFTGSVNVRDGSGNTTQLYLKGLGGTTEQVTFSPDSLLWGKISVGQTSGPKTVTLTNNQTVPLTISSISLGQDFILSSTTCPTAPMMVNAGASCSLTIAFRPLSSGIKNEDLTITDDAAGGVQNVTLQGTGTIGSLLFSPPSLSFAGVPPNTVSPPQTATLTNQTSSSQITLASITVSGHFAQTNDCPGTLAPQASCTITVTSNPVGYGSTVGSINVKDGSNNTTQLYLSGMGGVPSDIRTANSPADTTPQTGSTVYSSPSSLSWGSVSVGQTSGSKSITLNNGQSTPLTITSITSGQDFVQTANTCPLSPNTLASGASCSVTLAFRPLSSGTKSEPLTFAYSGSDTPLSVPVTATGTVGPLLYNTSSLTFSSLTAGTSSATQSSTLTNQTSSPIVLTSITVNGIFSQTNDCPISPNSLAAGASCTVTVTANPTASGTFTGTVNAKDSTGAVTQLYLTATASAPSGGTSGGITFSPTNLSWGTTAVGQTSGAKTLTVTNGLSTAITLSSISLGQDFITTSNTCPTSPASLAAGASCSISVAFRPLSTGSKAEAATFTYNGSGSPQSVPLTGTGTTGSLLFNPTSLSFDPVTIGSQSSPQTATLTNTTTGALTLSTITVNGNFSQTNTCPISPNTLAAGASCNISVTSTPATAGAFTGVVNAKLSTGAVTQLYLSGSGTGSSTSTGGTGNVTVSPKQYTFANQPIGTTSSPATITLTNGQSTAITISSIQISAPFQQTNNCGGTLAAGGSCTISITYAPTAVGYSSTNLTITDNASNSPQTVAIAGNAYAPVKLSNSSLGFSNQIVGRSSTPQTVTLTNQQPTPLTINSIAVTGSNEFQVTNTCIPNGSSSGTLAGNSSCSISVVFTPTATGSVSGAFTVSFNASGSPATVSYTGTGIVGDTSTSVQITPRSSCVLPSGQQQFAATVRNNSNQAVTWYVDGVQNGSSSVGFISTSGLYTAPASTGTHTVKAVSQAVTSASASTTISVTTSPLFTIDPYVSSIPVNGQQTFQGQICNVPDNNVTFSVDNIVGGNTTVGTIAGDGLYTAPATPGKHTVRVTDPTLNKTSGAVVNVFSGISVDFGSRNNTKYPIPSGILAINHLDGLHNPSDMALAASAGFKVSRTYANVPLVYATQTPDWTKIDPLIANLQALGVHVILQVAYTPVWLQPNPNPCGAGNTTAAPTNINIWAQLAASYVAHMDQKFPGVVTDYEIWNEPDSGSLCGNTNRLNTYLALYAAAAPLMKQQAAADGATIRVGGPTTAGANQTWITALLTNSSTAPYVDFVSYHNYIMASQDVNATWDTYNGNNSLYQRTQAPGGAASQFAKVASLVAAGQQPAGALTPIYVDEFNTNWAFIQDCCRNDPTYAPLWNAIYVSDLLNTVYSGTAAVPGDLAYYAATNYPYFCIIGTWDSHMDCQYTTNSTPQPYPQFYAYQLMASSSYLDMNSGGYMAASIAPPSGGGGLVTTAFYTPNQDSLLIINPTSANYSSITINLQNTGYSSPHAVLYQIVDGQRINSQSLALTQSNGSYTANIQVPAYTVLGIAVQGP